MRILALEPYYGGSHKAFLDGWTARSRHQWDVLGLPPNKWKWRMRHAAVTFADEVIRRGADGKSWDILFCSDMLNLAEFRGLVPPVVQALPSVAYFHENQLTYPVRQESDRDYSFVFTNLTTALSATSVWFNSAFHRDDFLGLLPRFLKKMPDHHPLDTIERIRAKAVVQYPGIGEFPPRGPRPPGPMRILWAARWEHDKNPEKFFQALKVLKWRGAEFRLSVLGEQFRERPSSFDWAREYFYYHIDWWGYQANRRDYEDALLEADVIVSSADHEFFGIGIVEAVAAGAFPVVPNSLAYPEILGPAHSDTEAGPGGAGGSNSDFFYDGTTQGLADRLVLLAERTAANDLWQGDPRRGRCVAERYSWDRLVPQLDDRIESVVATARDQ